MTQGEAWQTKYEEIVEFIKKNGRNPSRYDAKERGKYVNWLHHNKKLLNAGKMKPERVEKLTIVDFRHDSTLFERVRHCAHCSESLENFWN